MLAGINKQQPTCSIPVGDCNVKLSKWCPSDIDNNKDKKAGQDIDTFTTNPGYTQPTHIINDKSSYIDFLPLIANCSLKLELRKPFLTNAIIILYVIT